MKDLLISEIGICENAPEIMYMSTKADLEDYYEINEEELNEHASYIARLFKTLEYPNNEGVDADTEPMTEELTCYLYRDISGLDYTGGPCLLDDDFEEDVAVSRLITGIAVNPMNPDEVWVCFTGFNPGVKVWKSSNGGYNWTNADPNGTLFNLPSNGVLYQPGSDERLFLATDAGVWMKDENTDDWVKYGDIPNVRVTEMRIHHCTNRLRVSTFGRGIWETGLPVANGDIPDLAISSQTIWQEDKTVNFNIRIIDGGSLTVNSTLFMGSDSRIIVEPGGKLTLFGTLTNACGETWKGVEIRGNQFYSQDDISNQGYFKSNGGTIEYAEVGVLAGRRDASNNVDDGGGIIQCYNVTFRNNITDARFAPYHGFSDQAGGHNGTPTSVPKDNIGYFTKCLFAKDHNESASQTGLFYAGIHMDRVQGIKINGCDFDELTVLEDGHKGYMGSGIFSFDAIFEVNTACSGLVDPDGSCPGGEIPSTFNDFATGVRALSTNTATPFAIVQAEFTDNIRGVSAVGVSGATIIYSTFDINPQPNFEGTYPPLGIEVRGCTGYEIEENILIGPNPNAERAGIYLIDSGDDPNAIYLNDFANLGVGSIVQGDNRSITQEGLELYCGLYENCEFDIVIDENSSHALEQGHFDVLAEEWIPSSNVFSQSGCNEENSLHMDIQDPDQGGASLFIYHHHEDDELDDNVIPSDGCYTNNGTEFASLNNTGVQYVSRELACPSDISFSSSTSGKKEKITQKRAQEEDINEDLQGLVDGGDTQARLSTITIIPSLTNAEIRDDLLEHSPFLSDQVIEAIIENASVVSQWTLSEVLIANSPLTAEVFSVYETHLPLAPYLHDLFWSYQSGTNSRQEMESSLRGVRQQRATNEADYVKMFLLRDSSEFKHSEIWDFIITSESAEHSTLEYSLLLSEGDYSGALSTLSNYQGIDSYESLATIVVSGLNNGGLGNLSQTDLNALSTLASGDNITALYAQNIIEAYELESTESRYYGWPNPSLRSATIKASNSVEMPSLLSLSPNPASNFVTVVPELPEKYDMAALVIRDTNGKIVFNKEFAQILGFEQIDVQRFANGVYVVTLLVDDQMVENEKFTVVR